MSVRIINGKVYKNGTFSEEELVLKEGKIISAEDGTWMKSMMQKEIM